MIKQSLSTNAPNSDKRIKRTILVGPCAYGKTVVAAYLMKSIADNGKKVMFIADRIKLIAQTVETLDEYGIDCGVQQGNSPRSKPWANVQIASVQTLMARSTLPDSDVYIIDECHIQYSFIVDLMKVMNNCIFIGLTATSYSRGLGKIYQDMVVPTTTQELLDIGQLCPLRYMGGHKVDMSKVGTSNGEWRTSDLEHAVDSDEVLAGDIVKNWKRYAKGRHVKTVAFTPSIAHSKGLVELFIENGVSAHHIDCHTSVDDRELLYAAHSAGEFDVLSCSQLLNTGYDEKGIEYIVDCYPVKSLTTYVQRGGRGMRTYPGKTECIYADHAGNVEYHGFIESIVPSHLDDGDKPVSQESLTKQEKKEEAKAKKCPRCYQEYTGYKCACGFEVPNNQRLTHDGTDLVDLKAMSPAERRGHEAPQVEKDHTLAGLRMHMEKKSYDYGWVAHTYKEMYGDFPRDNTHVTLTEIPVNVKKFITGKNIRAARGHAARNRVKKTVSNL